MHIHPYTHTHTQMHTHTHHHGTLFSHYNNEVLLFKAMWIDLENIMLSEISQTERQKLYDITYLWNLKNKANTRTKQRRKTLKYIKKKKTSSYQWGEKGGEVI